MIGSGWPSKEKLNESPASFPLGLKIKAWSFQGHRHFQKECLESKPTQRTAELKDDEREGESAPILMALCMPLDPAVPEALSGACSFKRVSPFANACDSFPEGGYSFLYVCLDFRGDTALLFHETVIKDDDCFTFSFELIHSFVLK